MLMACVHAVTCMIHPRGNVSYHDVIMNSESKIYSISSTQEKGSISQGNSHNIDDIMSAFKKVF